MMIPNVLRLLVFNAALLMLTAACFASPAGTGSGNGGTQNGSTSNQDTGSQQQGGNTSNQQTSGSNQQSTAKSDQSSQGQSDITVGDKTGKIESYLLANAAAHTAASTIANRVSAADVGAVIVYDQVEQDRLAALAQFRMQASILSIMYGEALGVQIKPLPSEAQGFQHKA